MKILWRCPDCEKITEVTVWPVIRAKIYGPPKKCHPEEGGESEPGECEHCGAAIPNDAAYEQASEESRDRREAAAESRQEQRDEDRRLNYDDTAGIPKTVSRL